jgi:uncharacterized delta-60 repeat protein
VEFNEDMMIQLHNATPVPNGTDVGMTVGEVNQATLTILFEGDNITLGGQSPGQQPAGAVDRSWNKDNASDSTPPYLLYPGTTPGNGGTVYAVAEQPDGSAIIAGSFVSYDSTLYSRIVRVLPNGYQDPAFQGNSAALGNNSGANDFIAALALQPDGRIIIGGNFTAFNGSNRRGVARLNTDGSLDNSFSPGVGASGTVWATALETNGQIVIAGSFTNYNGTVVNQVARLNADGSLDTNFVVGVLGGTNVVVRAVAVDPSGRVLLGGNFSKVAGVTSGGVARLNVDGSLDTTFTAGIGTYNPASHAPDGVYAIGVQTNGQILIGGSFAYYDLVRVYGLTRLNTDGTLDLTFQNGSGTLNPITGNVDTVYSLLLQPDGNILIGGNFSTYNQTRRIGFARVFTDGSLDTSFMDTAYNEYAGLPNQYFNANVVSINYPYNNTPNTVYALALESNGITTSSNILIGGTFQVVGGGYFRDDVRPRSNVARVIGGGTPGPGNIEMMYNNYSVNNSDGTLYVSLVRTNGSLGIASATFSTNTAPPGAGVAGGTDFSLNPAYTQPTWNTIYNYDTRDIWDTDVGFYGPNFYEDPNFNPRPVLADVYIDVFNPGNITGNLSANLALSAPASSFTLGGQFIPLGTALGAQTTAPLTIIDSNVKSGVLGFSAASYSVIENGSTATITVTRTNGSENGVTVYYATGNGTATNGVDYTGTTNQLTFNPGQTSATFSVSTHNHYTSIQPDKTVNLRLYTPGGGATLGLTNAVLTLINPNYAPGHLSLSATNYSVAENAGSTTVTVNRLGGSVGTMQVTLLTMNGSAVNKVNYVGFTNTLFWNSGDATPQTISIPVIDDHVVTSNLVAFLQLTNSLVSNTNNPEPLAFGGTNATLTVDNTDSAGVFEFSAATYSVKQYGGYALIPVTRTGGSVGTVSVNYFTLDDTASNGVNYVGSTNTLTFTNGQVSQVLTVPILPAGTNALYDLFIRLSTNGLTTAAGLGAPANATLYIINSSIVNESPGSPDVGYTNTSFNGNVYSLVLQTNNQLLVGGDFTMADGVTRNRIARLNSDGSLDANFSLPTDSYGANGSVRSIFVQADGRILLGGFFTNINSSAYPYIARLNTDGTADSLFNPGSGADNPVYAVSETFVNGVSEVLVGGAFTSLGGDTFNGLGRLNSDGTPDVSFNSGGAGANATVYAMAVQSDGKILIGGDFTSYNGVTNFNHIARVNVDGSADTNFDAAGLGASDSVRAIALQLDGRILIGGLFTNVNGVALNHIARLNADGTVDASFNPQPGANDAVLAIGIQEDNRIVLGGEFTDCNGVTRSRITRLNPDGTVDPSINFGAGASDFVAAIAIQEDTIAGFPSTVPDEKIIIGGGFTQFNSQDIEYIARIYAGSIGGSGGFQFSSADYQIDENRASVVISVIRTGGTTNATTGDIFVTAATSNGSAIAGINYSNTVVTLDFPLGEVVRTFTVPVMDDGVVTSNLVANLTLSNPTPPADIGGQATSFITIINDDSDVSFSSANYSVAKNVVNGVAPITLVRSGSTLGTTVISFTTTNSGTALTNIDYTPTSQLVTFYPGVSDVVVDVPVTNNGLAEGNRTVNMELFGASGSVLINPSNAVLTIIDTVTSPGEFSFATNSYFITEGGGLGYTNVYVTIQRVFGLAPATVGFATQDGTAQSPGKYLATNGLVNFDQNVTNETIALQVANTATAEGTESFSINLTGPGTFVSPTNATVTIFNSNAGISFTQATNLVPENAGVANLLVQRVNNLNVVSSINFATVNGTAVAGVNFSNTVGTLTFGVGQTFGSIAVPLLNRSNLTDLAFGVNLYAPVNAQLFAPSNSLVILQGAAAGVSFSTNATTVFKNSGSVTITVDCSNPGAEPSGINPPLQVSYATVNGSATAGNSYNAVSGTLLFTNGVGSQTFTIPILNNNFISSNLTFSVVLSNVTAPGVITPYGVETVTIAESNVGLSFSQSAYTVYKNSGFATISVSRTGYTNAAASVDYSVTNGTAVAGQNFFATNGTLLFTNGVTSQSFNVQIIANSLSQPNLVALMQLSNPTNALILSPALATLTILETGGSYVIPAGAQLVTNYTSRLNDGIINSNDTVQVLFAFRDSAGFNVTNLIAYLQATNGIIPVTTQQTYGPLQVYRHSVSEPFTFTAHGTNTLTISPTFQLYDNAKYIGPAAFVFTVGSWTTTFANTNTIVINVGGAATPYPSVIETTGLGNALIKATVTLTNLSHGSIGDVDALVVSPSTNTLIMAHAGGGNGSGVKVSHVTLIFDDKATNAFALPPNGGAITNRPTQNYPVQNFP